MSPKLVYFDLETTGLDHLNKHRNVEIVSIGAVTDDDEDEEFVVHMLPEGDISTGATRVHGFVKRKGKLYFNGKRVKDAVTQKEGLEKFASFLDSVDEDGEGVALMAHNCHKFDAVVLCNNLVRQDVDLGDTVVDFVDSLVLARKSFPKSQVGNHQLATLVRTLLRRSPQNNEGKHDALGDAEDMREIYTDHIKGTKCKLATATLAFEDVYDEAEDRMRNWC